MAVLTQSMVTSFKVELLTAVHDMTPSTGDVFKLALYAPGATNNESTAAYSATDEVVGTGYSAGGAVVTTLTPFSSGTTAVGDFVDLTFSTVTLVARSALIYNSSKSNRAVCVLDFGRDVTKDTQDLVITFPPGDSETGIVRIA
jgi:hypothetical protein